MVSAKLLGVTFCSNFKFDEHFNNDLTFVVSIVIWSGGLTP